jgi:flavin reductase (DIM6/NTAB) family NADH-FMN oxidoreductase RutF
MPLHFRAGQPLFRLLLDKASTFSVCFLPAKDKKAIAYLGSHSGRDEDKIQGSHLDLAEEDGTPYFKDSELVLVAKKLVRAPLAREKITDPAIVQAFYPQDGFHYVYVGEIVKVLKR